MKEEKGMVLFINTFPSFLRRGVPSANWRIGTGWFHQALIAKTYVMIYGFERLV
jgi:hypothetical protein